MCGVTVGAGSWSKHAIEGILGERDSSRCLDLNLVPEAKSEANPHEMVHGSELTKFQAIGWDLSTPIDVESTKFDLCR